jgi:hypothetical protein
MGRPVIVRSELFSGWILGVFMIRIRVGLIALLPGLLGSVSAFAADTWTSTTGVLNAPIVKYSDNRYYSNVTAVVGSTTSAGTTTKPSSVTAYDTYDSTTSTLTIPEVKVVTTKGSTTYYNVTVKLSSITSVGGVCGSADTCAKYSGAAPFASVLAQTYYTSALTSVTTPATRMRYLISNSATASSTTANFLSVGSTYSATTGYAAEGATIPTSATYKTYLSKLMYLVADSTTATYYRLDSHLHPNQSIDYDSTDSNKLKFRNNFGKASTTYGYIVFSYDSTTKLLQAKKRYKYSYNATTYKATYTQDTAFAAADYYVNLTSGVYKLVSGTTSATKLYLYSSPIDFNVPTDFNPAITAYQTNADQPFSYKAAAQSSLVEGTTGSVYKSLSTNTTYQNQVKTVGSDPTTKANADAYLATIKTQLASAGSSLRYDTSVYTTFRDSLLASTLVSDAIADGTPGGNLVPYVYFTNDQTSGVYHPFMNIITYGNGADPHGLRDVPRPPGAPSTDGSCSTYTCSNVTRFANRDYYAIKIPMKDYGQVTTASANTLAKSLYADVYTTAALQAANPKTVLNYASTADNGIMINGAVMFPAYSNTLTYSQAAGELSINGCHVGQGGGGPHCHADGYQSGRGVGMYNDNDYTNKTHPPLIGFGYDGVALFGRYRTTTDAALLGYSIALDDFGAHNHDSIGYHYHAHTTTATTTTQGPSPKTYSYTVRYLIKGAYAGKVNSIPGFSAW